MPPRPEYPTFARLLRAALERDEGRTGTWLAERLGFTQQHASDIITGKHRPPRGKIEAMAELLGLEGDQRQTFLDEAYLTHVPDFIRARLTRLEDRLRSAISAGESFAAEVGALSADVTRLQRAAADLAALKSAVAGIAARHPAVAQELRELLAEPPLDEPVTEGP